ncbi:MAG: type IV toxin-antitoxin system AbiEi family antitoxin domain-containing protein [Solirubrobacterales bacterium]
MRGQSARNHIWELVERQHGVVTRRQLLELGMTAKAVDRRIASGRLHPIWRGIYAVGRPRLGLRGWWLGAVLACGHEAVLSHFSAAALWGIRGRNIGYEGERDRPGAIHVSVAESATHRRKGIRAHRRRSLAARDRASSQRIPVTAPGRTLIDIAPELSENALERAVNEADRLELIDPESLRSELEVHRGMDGAPALRRVLDRRTFTLTDSDLERRFVSLIRRAGLPSPLTQQEVNGFRVDFFWPEPGLVVETDGLRYHRTPAQQSSDRVRDQVHTAAGLTALRFTHAQVRFDPDRVVKTLRSVLR